MRKIVSVFTSLKLTVTLLALAHRVVLKGTRAPVGGGG